MKMRALMLVSVLVVGAAAQARGRDSLSDSLQGARPEQRDQASQSGGEGDDRDAGGDRFNGGEGDRYRAVATERWRGGRDSDDGRWRGDRDNDDGRWRGDRDSDDGRWRGDRDNDDGRWRGGADRRHGDWHYDRRGRAFFDRPGFYLGLTAGAFAFDDFGHRPRYDDGRSAAARCREVWRTDYDRFGRAYAVRTTECWDRGARAWCPTREW